MARLSRRRDEADSRIADHRGARVAHEREDLAGVESLDQPLQLLLGAVGVEALEWHLDAVVAQQHPRAPGVLGEDPVGLLQDLQRAQGDVAHVANRGGDHPEGGLAHVAS